ncbi:hypothetical protein E6H30_01270 [Candidatus Bathyarchaeota archaeon]|nr:MAG: hypothetical protein E6H30_01270 [Candidatus Bathyarchaeota archaeon]
MLLTPFGERVHGGFAQRTPTIAKDAHSKHPESLVKLFGQVDFQFGHRAIISFSPWGQRDMAKHQV